MDAVNELNGEIYISLQFRLVFRADAFVRFPFSFVSGCFSCLGNSGGCD